MKERISKFVQAILPAVVVGLMAVPTAHAQENFVPADTAFRRIERMAPDSISGEVLHLNEYLGDKLFRTTIRYKDGVVKVQEFQSSGVLKGEVVTATDGTTTITLYTADGKGLFRVTELKNQRVEQKEYRDDGKTLWTSTVLTQSGRLVEYFDASGRMRVRRAFLPQGVMRVTVLDPQGKTSYTQIWISGIAGYVLSSVEEPLANGESRTVHVLGGKVDKCEYIDQDGKVIRVESKDALSAPMDPTRLREFAPGDDPSIPLSQEPERRLKR